ncbi:MAG TPA: cytidine deaminase [Candidatus Gracilibacteria bacterium]|nr:cytidine deaminase [Candidatus Gracilibacteria bacterium]HRY91136.1 cytidine deaminase [Candidatus Gracilibacteria bacterium]
MSEKIEQVHVTELLDRAELSDEQRADLEVATKARLSAYAPYTHFQVGAAIRTADDEVYSGWNLQTIMYEGPHAEANAICHMAPESREAGIKRVTVVGAPEGDENYEDACRCCGECRQFLFEFLKPGDNPEVISAGVKGKVKRTLLRQDLPDAFSPEVLKKA